MSADFWMGTTIGAAVVLVILLAIVFGAGSANEKKAKARNSEANNLLRARNAIGMSQAVALDRIAEAMIDQRKFEVETLRDSLPVEVKPSGIHMIVRKDEPSHADYLKARFANGSTGTFMFCGHRWRYEYTSFDDHGHFDVLWRPDEKLPVEDGDPEPLPPYDPSRCNCHINPPCHYCTEGQYKA